MISSSKFSYDAETNTLSADVSDLGPNPWTQAYPDAADLGILIVSHRTGQEVMFVVDKEHRTEGELIQWELKPILNRTSRLPVLETMRMRLWND